jgi:hypothetical protein
MIPKVVVLRDWLISFVVAFSLSIRGLKHLLESVDLME